MFPVEDINENVPGFGNHKYAYKVSTVVWAHVIVLITK